MSIKLKSLIAICIITIGLMTVGHAVKNIRDQSIGMITNNEADQINEVIIEKVNLQPVHITDREGKKDKLLADKIRNAGSNDMFRVAIWIKTEGLNIKRSDIESNNLDKINKNKKSEMAKINVHMSIKQKALKDYLKSKNKKILYESRYAPMIYAELTKDDIQKIESRDDVTLMQLEIQYQEMIKDSVPTVMALPVQNYINGGVVGGATVAVVENDGIAFSNPYLNNGGLNNRSNGSAYYFNRTNLNIGNHATGIAGIIASTNSTYKGIVGNMTILSANSQTLNDSDLTNATEWAMDNGASILSNSWVFYTGGNWTPMTSYYDYIVQYGPWPTVVFSSGNCGTCSYPYNIVAAPALGYNVIAVGSFDDKGTGWRWSDDIMSSFSSHGRPPSPYDDRQKPEVVAVGAHSAPNNYGIMSTIAKYPWIGTMSTGTSFSAPEVSGEASILMNISPVLTIWPEAVRAIIMVSADHNIEGDSRLSSKDGVGGINILEAYNIVKKGRGIGWDVTPLYYNSGNSYYGPNIAVNEGQKIRVVITWNSNATGYGGNDTLNADIDLYIQRLSVNGTWADEPLAGRSISADNNYEIVEFNAPMSTTYRAKIVKYRWNDTNHTEYLGYAVYIK